MITDREYQIENLKRIFNDGALSPAFHPNQKYQVKGRGIIRIAYGDVMDYKYIIRYDKSFSSNSYWNENAEVIAEYESIENLVDDGWRLD